MGEAKKAAPRAFPNYRTVTMPDGQVLKIAPLRMNSEEAIQLATIQGKAMQGGSHALFLEHADKFIPALKKSLAEHHSKEAIEKAVNNFQVSVNLYSPYIQCMWALAGLEPAIPPDPDAEDETED